jgi:hypothetical protein
MCAFDAASSWQATQAAVIGEITRVEASASQGVVVLQSFTINEHLLADVQVHGTAFEQ